MSKYEERLALVREVSESSPDRYRFVHYSGKKDAPHVVLGVLHEPAASVSLSLMVNALIVPNACVFAERSMDVPNFTIDDAVSLAQNMKHVNDWQCYILPKLMEKKGALVSYDCSALQRRTKAGEKDHELFMQACTRREYRFAARLTELAQRYARVVGVFGSAHVISPIFDGLPEKDFARYVFSLPKKGAKVPEEVYQV